MKTFTTSAAFVIASLVFFVVVITLPGCATVSHVVPDTVSPVFEHVSHMTQHAPFTSHPTDYGYNQVAIQAHWNLPANAFLEVSEGYNLNARNTNGQACGGLYGGREVFTARVGYTFHVK